MKTTLDDEGAKEHSSGQLIGSVQKALNILGAFTRQKPELSLTDLAALLSLNKSTLFGLLRTLEKNGYVAQNPQTKRYRLGMQLLDRAALAMDYADVSRIAPPYLDELCEKVEENVHLGVLDNGEVIYLYRVQGPHTLSMNSHPGMRTPVHCTAMGKVLLAFLPEVEAKAILMQRELIAYTPHTITDLAQLQQYLREVRQQGYALDAEERDLGNQCVAAPIFDMHDKVVAAISVSIPSVRIGGLRLSNAIRHVKEYAWLVSRQLGGQSGDAHEEKTPAK